MNRPGAGDGPAGETTPAGPTRVTDRPAETRVAGTPAAETRVAETPPPVAPSPPATADPIVLDPAPAAALDTSHAEPSVTAMLRGQRPEVLVGAAFAGGVVAAMILRRLGG